MHNNLSWEKKNFISSFNLGKKHSVCYCEMFKYLNTVMFSSIRNNVKPTHDLTEQIREKLGHTDLGRYV